MIESRLLDKDSAPIETFSPSAFSLEFRELRRTTLKFATCLTLFLAGGLLSGGSGRTQEGSSAQISSQVRSSSAAQLFARGKYTQARQAYQTERKQFPNDVTLQQGLIRTLYRLDQWKEGLAEARALVARSPDDATAHALLATLQLRAGLPAEASKSVETALSKNAQQVDALIARGRLEMWEGQRSKANATLRQALATEPDNTDAAYYLIDTYDNEVSPAMLKDIDSYIALNPKGHPHELAVETLPSLRTLLPHFMNDAPFHAGAPVSEEDLKQADTGDAPISIFTSPFEQLGNYVVMPVKIDGAPMRFLFDTGGGFTVAMSKKAAARLTLPSLGRSFVRGVNGREASVQAKADTMQVGGETFRAIPIDMLNSNSGEEDGIFGVSNFDHYAVTIDFTAKQLILARGKNAVAPPAKPGNSLLQIPFHLLNGDILIPIQVEGSPLWALVDTGADAELILSLDVAHAIAARRRAGSFVEQRIAAHVGLGNTIKQQTLLVFKDPIRLNLLGAEGKERTSGVSPGVGADLVDTQVSPAMMFQIGGIIGIEYLRKATRVTIDYPHRLLTLEFSPEKK